MRQRGKVSDSVNGHAAGSKGTQGSVSAATYASNANLNVGNTHGLDLLKKGSGDLSGGVGGGFACALETVSARGLPGQYVTDAVGHGNLGIVKRRADIHNTKSDVLANRLLFAFALFCFGSSHKVGVFRCSLGLLGGTLAAAAYRHLLSLAGAGIGLSTLTTYRKALGMS